MQALSHLTNLSQNSVTESVETSSVSREASDEVLEEMQLIVEDVDQLEMPPDEEMSLSPQQLSQQLITTQAEVHRECTSLCQDQKTEEDNLTRAECLHSETEHITATEGDLVVNVWRAVTIFNC